MHGGIWALLKHKTMFLSHIYTEYAGLDIAVILCIASPFSLRIAISNAGPKLHWLLWEQNQLFAAIF